MLFSFGLTILLFLQLGQSVPKIQVCSYAEKENRDLTRYEKLGPFEITPLNRGKVDVEKTQSNVRDFVWNHWQERRLGYAAYTTYTIEGEPTTYSFFVEPDPKGSWRVIMVRESLNVGRGGHGHHRSIVDKYFAYLIKRIIPPIQNSDRIDIPSEDKPTKPDSYRLFLKDEEGLELTVF